MAGEWEALTAKYSGKQDAAPQDEWGSLSQKYSTPVVAQEENALTEKGSPSNMPALSRMEKIGRGMTDPIVGVAQLLYNALPQSVRDAGDSLNNWMADKTGLVPKIPERNLSSLVTGQQSGLNALIANNEKEYQARRQAGGESGIDGYRMLGNFISPANMAVAIRAMQVAAPVKALTGSALAGNVAGGALGGAAQGAITPAYENDYWAEKKAQTGIGAGVGGAIPVLGRLIPKNTAAAQELKSAGVDVPVGSAMGGIAKSVEDRLSSVPIIGDAINANRKTAIDQFNIATLNKALDPINEKLSKGILPGHEAIAEAGQKVSNAYNNLLPKLKIQADGQFAAEMNQLKQMAQNLPDAEMNQFNRIIANEVEGKFTQAGLMSGETMKQVESKLGQLAKGYGRSEGYEKQQLADALRQAQANLRGMVARNNPDLAPELQKVNTAFAMLQRPERAAAYVGAEGGVFTPSQLMSAVKASDSSLRHKAFARGDAMMQDWAGAAKSTLPNKIPDSGTASRLMLGGGALGGLGYISPEAAMATALASSAYLPIGRQVASGALNLGGKASNLVASNPAYLAPIAAPVAYGLLNSPQ